MPIGDARPFQAGQGNIVRDVVVPVVNSAGKIASGVRAARADIKKRSEATAARESAPTESVQEPLPATKVMPQARDRSYGDAVRATLKRRNIQGNIAAARQFAAQESAGYTPAGTTTPDTLEQIPNYAVGKAMQPQRRQEVHSALSALQHKTIF